MMMMGTNGGGVEKWPAPRVAFENTFVRGRGKVLQVSTSRPFELRARGSLFVLDGSVVCVEPSAGDVSEAAPAQVTLERVTTYLTKHVVSQKAAEKRTEGKGNGLVQLLAHAEQCLFVPALESASLVHLERIDSMEQMEAVFQWKDARQNVYGFKSDQPLLSIVPENADATMRLERVERDRWLARWRESDYAFGEVSFAAQQASKRLDGAKPGDFEVKSVMPPVKSDAGDFGAPVEVLKKGAEE